MSIDKDSIPPAPSPTGLPPAPTDLPTPPAYQRTTFAAPPVPLADVDALIAGSEPRRTNGRFAILLGLFGVAVIGGMFMSDDPSGVAGAVRIFSSLLMLGLIVAMGFMSWTAVRAARAEQKRVGAAEELVQLRRWPEASGALHILLSEPMRTPPGRILSLVLLAQVLARYGRFEDAIKVQNYLLDNVAFDGPAAHAIGLGRVLAMLHQDHLVDADRALADLRRSAGRVDRQSARDEGSDAGPIEIVSREHRSAGLALVEMYRDVKTGHPEEAVDLFISRLPIFQEQLGQRVADVYALAAKAYDLLGDGRAAEAHYERATLLSPASELQRRYPEVATLAPKYRAAVPPPEIRPTWEAA